MSNSIANSGRGGENEEGGEDGGQRMIAELPPERFTQVGKHKAIFYPNWDQKNPFHSNT